MAKTLGELEQLILLALVALGDDAYGASIRRAIVSRTRPISSTASGPFGTDYGLVPVRE